MNNPIWVRGTSKAYDPYAKSRAIALAERERRAKATRPIVWDPASKDRTGVYALSTR